MKVKSVQIQGMHKVESKMYKFNDGLTYFIGPNGTGKSTILQAVQLGILGYVPGLPKTAESIFSHANGPTMSVTVNIDKDGQDISISRSWMRSGSSVKSALRVDPATISESDIASWIGEMELPQFNFGEFNALTANKLKDWFIDFFPKSTTSVNWAEEFKNAAEYASEDFLSDVLDEINSNFSDISGVEQVRRVNEFLKEKMSFLKGQLASAESTVKTLVFYDDTDTSLNLEDIDKQIKELSDMRVELARYETSKNTAVSSKQSAELEINALQKILDSFDFEDAEKLTTEFNNAVAVLSELSSEYLEAKTNWQAAQKTYSSTCSEKIADKCPMLGCECDKLEDLKSAHEVRLAEAKSAVESAKEIHDEVEVRYKSADTAKQSSEFALKQLEQNIVKCNNAKARIETLQSIISKAEETLALSAPTSSTESELVEQINKLTEQGRKVKANQEYNNLIEKFTAEKFKLDSKIEVLKLWVKLTDANGLQTTLMDKPFEEFEGKLTAVLRTVFSDQSASAKFNLISKANSFSFGIIRNNQYVKFDLLSSGEKCLYTFAMLVTLLNDSDTSLKLMLIDDALDHLDDENASKLFEAMKKLDGMQFILAGVKQVDNADFKVEV